MIYGVGFNECLYFKGQEEGVPSQGTDRGEEPPGRLRALLHSAASARPHHLTQCIKSMVLESRLFHKTVNFFF